MRKLALLLALTLAPAQAWALNTDQLLSTIAMPLAVAALSNATGVDPTQLGDLVTSLNQANVPAPQVVDVVQNVPVTLVDQNGQPIATYVQQQISQGVTGSTLGDQLLARFGSNPLALIALPLAVDAVSNMTGVPQDELANLVATLNNANVPPAQEIEIIRYAPVALVADNGQPFVAYVQQQVAQGVTGPALVPVVVQQLQTYYPAQTQIAVTAPPPAYTPSATPVAVAPAPQPVYVERQYTPPPVVVSRVQEYRAHPHGGPPGQLKRELGYQTGAEVVHGGEKRGRQFTPVAPAPVAPVVMVPRGEEHGHGHGRGHENRQAAPAPMISSAPPMAAPPAAAPAAAPPGPPPGHGPGKGGDNGHGHGHGHGKD